LPQGHYYTIGSKAAFSPRVRVGRSRERLQPFEKNFYNVTSSSKNLAKFRHEDEIVIIKGE